MICLHNDNHRVIHDNPDIAQFNRRTASWSLFLLRSTTCPPFVVGTLFVGVAPTKSVSKPPETKGLGTIFRLGMYGAGVEDASDGDGDGFRGSFAG